MMVASKEAFQDIFKEMMHPGMLPDFIQDMKNLGLTDEDLLPLFRSAEEYIRVWEKCEQWRTIDE